MDRWGSCSAPASSLASPPRRPWVCVADGGGGPHGPDLGLGRGAQLRTEVPKVDGLEEELAVFGVLPPA
jgi:hypothetical protein